MLHFICSYFNFSNSAKIKNNYIQFRKHFPHPITTVEIALPDQKFFIEDSIKIKADTCHIFWQKERCLNLAIDSLPDSAKYIAWIDTDIRFHRDSFKEDTLNALENYPLVQMFEHCFENPDVNSYNNNVSMGYKLVNKLDSIDYPHIGYCWAFHKDILVDNKLYDADPVGNSDALQLMAWMGIWNHQVIIDLNVDYRKEFLLWAWNSYENVESNIGCIPGVVEHFYHGKTEHREYNRRNNILNKHNFVPSKDLSIDKNGLYKLNNKALTQDIYQYFSRRSKYE